MQAKAAGEVGREPARHAMQLTVGAEIGDEVVGDLDAGERRVDRRRGEADLLRILPYGVVRRPGIHTESGCREPVALGTEELAARAAEVFRLLGSPRKRAADIAIGVTAAALGATLLTRNKRDFAGVPHLTLESS